jgi:ABC-2 type transport system ATP-binding protein
MSRDDCVLHVHNLAKTFRVGFWRTRVEAVRGVDFEVRDNEIFGIVGPNGAGKTTTMKMITNLVFPDRGEIELFGASTEHAESRRRLGYLPEEPYFYEHLTAAELLRYYGSLHGLSGDEMTPRIDSLLETVGLEEARDRPVREFSKGMRQRAGIAQALINDPDLVILDEPQSGLDPLGRKEVRDLIYNLREEGKTVIFSSHILVDVEAVCDRVAILDDGRLVDVVDLGTLDRAEAQKVVVTVEGLESSDIDESMASLQRVEVQSGALSLTFEGDVDVNEALAAIAEQGGTIRSVSRRHRRLEEQFLEETDADEVE